MRDMKLRMQRGGFEMGLAGVNGRNCVCMCLYVWRDVPLLM